MVAAVCASQTDQRRLKRGSVASSASTPALARSCASVVTPGSAFASSQAVRPEVAIVPSPSSAWPNEVGGTSDVLCGVSCASSGSSFSRAAASSRASWNAWVCARAPASAVMPTIWSCIMPTIPMSRIVSETTASRSVTPRASLRRSGRVVMRVPSVGVGLHDARGEQRPGSRGARPRASVPRGRSRARRCGPACGGRCRRASLRGPPRSS